MDAVVGGGGLIQLPALLLAPFLALFLLRDGRVLATLPLWGSRGDAYSD